MEGTVKPTVATHGAKGAGVWVPDGPGPPPQPGRRGWRAPFAVLAAEGPSGTEVVAVLAQEGVRARWSGAALPGHDGGLLIEVVAGFGDDFMLARAAPARLPDRVLDDVRRVGARAAALGRSASSGPRRRGRLGAPAPPGHGRGVRHHDLPRGRRRAGTASTRGSGWRSSASCSPPSARTRASRSPATSA